MAWFNWFAKNTPQKEHKITAEDVQHIVGDFNKWSTHIQGIPEILEAITFDEAVSYFQSDRPRNTNVKKGAIIWQEHPEGQRLGQVFLDGNNQLICRPNGTPYGRQLVTKKLDKKLNAIFGDRELIAFELKAQESGGYEFPLPKDIVLEFGEWLRNLVKIPEVVPIVTYEDSIKYFITDRPNDPRIQKGAILRQPHTQGYHLAQVFLDKNNQVVLSPNGELYGRQLVARELDEELLEVFGNKKIIIVE